MVNLIPKVLINIHIIVQKPIREHTVHEYTHLQFKMKTNQLQFVTNSIVHKRERASLQWKMEAPLAALVSALTLRR